MVTGSSRGFGFEFAKGFAEDNCAIFIAVLAVKNEIQGQRSGSKDKWQNICGKDLRNKRKGIQELPKIIQLQTNKQPGK